MTPIRCGSRLATSMGSVLLAEHDAMSFSRLKQVLEETNGSLGTHLRKLEDGGFLAIEKSYRDRRPVTWYELTEAGRSEPVPCTHGRRLRFRWLRKGCLKRTSACRIRFKPSASWSRLGMRGQFTQRAKECLI